MSRRTGKILMIDDEVELLQLSSEILSLEGHAVQTRATAEEGWALLEQETFDVILLDLRLPGMSGLAFLERLQPKTRPEEVIVLTAYAEVESAVRAMKAGAYGYVAKPFNAEAILAEIDKILEVQALRAENRALRRQQGKGLEGLIGEHASMRQLRQRIREVAPTPWPVLILGETGTGKERVAEALHAESDRADKPLVRCNFAALAPGLLESELFGHVKGAFTGAIQDRPGRFAEADGGTLFLDEIGDLSPEMQIRLLRVLQEQAFEPVGSTRTQAVDVRLITATHQDLEAAMVAGRFREDLFFRINGITLPLPPLRERRSDIPLLGTYFLRRYGAVLSQEVEGCSAEALGVLEAYSWPGNVRELENVLKGALTRVRGRQVEAEHLRSLLPGLKGEGETPPGTWLYAISTTQFHAARQEFETLFIRHMLRASGGNISQAAQRMQLERRSLQRKMREYGIEVEAFRLDGRLREDDASAAGR